MLYTFNFLFFKESSRVIHFINGSVCWSCNIYLQKCKTPPISMEDMTLNNLMVRLHKCWNFAECGLPVYCHRFQVYSGPE